MSDIFISYSSKDRPWVEGFAKALQSRAWSVWWDRQIPTGESFDTVIERELLTAKCVIVVWSHSSVTSDWVKTEAASARERKVLLPVLVDDAKLPLEFKRMQTQYLQDWQDGIPHTGFDRLVLDIAGLLGSKPVEGPRTVKPWWARLHPLWLLSLPTVVTAVIVVILMQWPISTRVQIELTTERAEFQIEAVEPMLGPIDARSLAIDKFKTISFEPESMEVADPSQYQMETDDFPPSAWSSLRLAGPKITLTPQNATRNPRITVEGLNRGGLPTIRLDPVSVTPGAHVTLETRGGKTIGLTIKIAGQDSITLSVREPVRLMAQHTEVEGLAERPFDGHDELTYRVRLPERAAWMEVTAQPDGPILSPTFASDRSDTPIFKGIPVATLDFTRQARAGERVDAPAGERVSALTGKGTVTFPDYQHLGSVSLSTEDAVGIDGLDGFRINQIDLPAKSNGMHLIGTGIAKQIRTKSGKKPIPYRLTAFDALAHNGFLMTLSTMVIWVFPTTLGAYRLWKEFKR